MIWHTAWPIHLANESLIYIKSGITAKQVSAYGALPRAELQNINLAQELVLQFMRVKELQTDTLGDERVKANQKAQVANSVAATLAQLTKLQTELHTAERLKAIEGMLIRHLKTLPLEVVEAFLGKEQ
jgi:uncharacterized membrane protein YdbT with pleckstrin-like domain